MFDEGISKSRMRNHSIFGTEMVLDFSCVHKGTTVVLGTIDFPLTSYTAQAAL